MFLLCVLLAFLSFTSLSHGQCVGPNCQRPMTSQGRIQNFSGFSSWQQNGSWQMPTLAQGSTHVEYGAVLVTHDKMHVHVQGLRVMEICLSTGTYRMTYADGSFSTWQRPVRPLQRRRGWESQLDVVLKVQ